MSDAQTKIPRWALGAAETLKAKPEWLWEQINDLLMDGMMPKDVWRELGLPENKLRSLTLYAQKFGPRRRLVLFNRFKETLLGGAVQMSEDFVTAMSCVARYAVSDNVPAKKQQAACDLMNEYTKTVVKLMKTDETSEAERTKDESKPKAVDGADLVRLIEERLGITIGERGEHT